MDMHSKREMRKNKKMNEDTKNLPSTSINCLITLFATLSKSTYKIRTCVD